MDLVSSQENSIVQLFAGDFPRVAKAVTLLAGAGVLAIGTVLGKITKGAAASATKAGGNTGDGTLTIDSITPILPGSKAGIYKVRVIRAALEQIGTTPAVPAQLALCELKDSSGQLLEVFELPEAPGVTISNNIKFQMVEGSTPFAAGDGFDITIASASGKYVPYDYDASNGSEYADCILAETIVVGSSDEKAVAYKTGYFNSAALTGYDAEAAANLEEKGIFVGSVV